MRHEAETVALETQGIVKVVSVFAAQIARKRQLVAPRLAARLTRVLHHRAANPLALPRRQYRHIFYHAGGRSPLAELFHNEQRVGARDLAVRHRDQQPEARTLPDSREMFR